MRKPNKSQHYKIGIFGLGAIFIALSCWSCQNSMSKSKTTEISPSQSQNEGFVSIFDGKTLEGWEGDAVYWSVVDGVMVGEITPETLLKTNTFIIWEGGEPADFELKVDYKISDAGNSGFNYRSDRVEEVPFALKGYQADIDGQNRYTGQNYEERKRTTLAYRGQKTRITSQESGDVKGFVERNAWKGLSLESDLGDRDTLGALIKKDDWNTLHVVIKGNVLQHFVNGTLMSEVTDDDPKNRKMSGLMGFQVHVGPPMRVEFKNIMLKEF